MTRAEHIKLCAKQAALCLAATCNESLSAAERLGAQQGEVDWLAEKAWLEAQPKTVRNHGRDWGEKANAYFASQVDESYYVGLRTRYTSTLEGLG